jgi:hypothetical protein
MTINVAYCFHQNNDVAHWLFFANIPVAQAAAADRDSRQDFAIAKNYWAEFTPGAPSGRRV